MNHAWKRVLPPQNCQGSAVVGGATQLHVMLLESVAGSSQEGWGQLVRSFTRSGIDKGTDVELQNPLDRIAAFAYSPKQREYFRNGKLWKQWLLQYPDIFDNDDESLVRNQAALGYHFYEWLGAVLIFHTTGYLSLIEKYQFSNHKRKRSILLRLGALDLIDKMAGMKTRNRAQLPDLLVYKPDYSEWHLCELKGENDRYRTAQRIYFQQIQKMTNEAVKVIRFYPQPGILENRKRLS